MEIDSARRDHAELLEREAQLAVVTDAVSVAVSGVGSAVVVEAPSGLGKTKLLAQARSIARDAGAEVLWARGTELERRFAFGVVRQLLEPVVATRSDLLDGPASQVTGLLGGAVPEEHPAGDLALLHGLYWLVVNLCRLAPLVIAVDDLHWADPPSLRFLAYLLPRLDGLPVLVAATVRPSEPHAEQRLIDLMATDPAVRVLRLQPLSETASADIVRGHVGMGASDAFCAACFRLAGGNPLLLHELTAAAAEANIPPTDEGVSRLEVIGADAVGTRVKAQMRMLSDDAVELAHAVAVLDGGTSLRDAAQVADLNGDRALRALAALVAIGVLDRGEPISFVHPLVQAAVYRRIGVVEQATLHGRAARVMAEIHRSAQRAAAHLLHVPNASVGDAVAILVQAAGEAVACGAADAALSYLRHALAEPLTSEARLDVLTRAGDIAVDLDHAAAADFLLEAFELTEDPRRRAEIAVAATRVLPHVGRSEEARGLVDQVRAELPDTDLRRRLLATELHLDLTFAPHDPALRARIEQVRQLDPDVSVGGRTLDCVLARYDLFNADPRGVDLARRGVGDGLLIRRFNGDAAINAAWVTLLAAVPDEAMASVDVGVAQARADGSIYALSSALTYRGWVWLVLGQLKEAETDLCEACQAVDLANAELGRQFTGPPLVNALIEQGRLEAATQAQQWMREPAALPAEGPWYLALESRARLLRATGNPQQAAEAALAAGRLYAAGGGVNPAVVAWRSEAALSLHALNRVRGARDLAAEEVALARRWGAPWPLGRALRVAGLVGSSNDAVATLQEAVQVLALTPARLEHAKALHSLGRALRTEGDRSDARRHLSAALDLAGRCGAHPLVEATRAELRAAGGRPRRDATSGPDALTPSERRVASLVADGHTNREIAQALFVTPKTVEVHLSSAYRKLNVRSRVEMVKVLAAG